MQPLKRLLRAHWTVILLPLLLISIPLIYLIWLLGTELVGRLSPATKRVAGVVLIICLLLLTAIAIKLRPLLFFLVSVVVHLRASMSRSEQGATLDGLDGPVTVTF